MAEQFDFGAMLNAQFASLGKNGIRYAKADRDVPDESVSDAGSSAEGPALDASLKASFDSDLPVEGLVEKEVKGGYEVTVKGTRAFCPYSQMDRFRKPVANDGPNPFVGQTLTFRIQEYGADDRGVNLIVSRRVQLEAELATARDYLRDTLAEGQTVNGSVVKVLDFGCFVDLGGVEGLVPAREISWDKVDDPRKFVAEGELVTVKVLSLDWGRNRFSLSIRQTQAKPVKPRSPEEIAAEAEAADVKEWLEAHASDEGGFSAFADAFAKVGRP